MTLIEVRKADGTLVGRCDSRCYNGRTAKCHCVCGGRNHGVGLRQAIKNNQEGAEFVIAAAPQSHIFIDTRPLPEAIDLFAELPADERA